MKPMEKHARYGFHTRLLATMAMSLLAVAVVTAVEARQAPPPVQTATGPGGQPLPADYVIGPDDVLAISYWRNEDMSAEVVVRPDGRISLPLLNDIVAAGLTPEQLRLAIVEAASPIIESPAVTVQVRELKSRKVYITGMVAQPNAYPLTGPTRVIQLISMAGGLLEYAKTKDIRVVRTEGDRQVSFRFNYNDFRQGRNLEQNILLRPGDTVVVP
jgi:polysaccharide export outer membrane protein